MMAQALWIVFYLITGAAALAINWLIWFRLLPILFRQLRDQHRDRQAPSQSK